MDSTQPIACPKLTLVTAPDRSVMALPELVAAAISGGVDAIQLRVPKLSAGERSELADALIPVCGDRALLVINRDWRLAGKRKLALHLPENMAAPTVSFRFVSRSVHSVEAAARATGANALIAGHIYESASKPGLPPIGVSGLRQIVAASRTPVIAIGGITSENAQCCIREGANGVAVIGAISEAADPESAARRLRRAVDQAFGWRLAEESEGENVNQHHATEVITFTLNGKASTVEPNTTVLNLLHHHQLRPQLVAVEYNGDILRREQFDTTALRPADQVEIVHFVGGG